jgi:hypothetical protein
MTLWSAIGFGGLGWRFKYPHSQPHFSGHIRACFAFEPMVNLVWSMIHTSPVSPFLHEPFQFLTGIHEHSAESGIRQTSR